MAIESTTSLNNNLVQLTTDNNAAVAQKAAEAQKLFVQASDDSLTQAQKDELLKKANEAQNQAVALQLSQNKKVQSEADVANKISEIKAKYCSNLGSFGGDPYSDGNPELQALGKALDDGLFDDLDAQGFSRDQILNIVNSAFPTVGIALSSDGSYSLPLGHGEQAANIYRKFKNTMLLISTGGSEEMRAAREKIAALNKQITENNNQLKALDSEIKYLSAEIKVNLEKIIKDSEEIKDDQKDATNDAVQKRIREYTDSKGEMTFEEFQSVLANDLDTIAGSANSKLSNVMLKMIQTESKMTVLSSYLSSMKSINDLNKTLSGEVIATTQSLEQMKEEFLCGDMEDSSCMRCDPIGFNKDGAMINFFLDSDNNGGLTNETEFVGANNGFDEMLAMDLNNDGILTQEEMAQNNLKVVITKDGKQEIQDAANFFKQGDSVNLKSYNSINQEMSNGNKLVGTFDVNMDGKMYNTGYQTLDKLDWLDDNFEFTDEDEGKGRHAQDITTPVNALDYTDKYNAHMESFEELRAKADETWAKLGVDSTEIKTEIANNAMQSAKATGEEIETMFDAQKAQQAAQEKLEAQQQEQKELEEKQKEENK